MASEASAERKEVEDYLKTHDLQQVLNAVVNETIKSKAETPLEFMQHLLQNRDKRGILQVTGREVLDETGRPAIGVDILTPRGTFSAVVAAGPTDSEVAAVSLKDADPARFAGGGATMAAKMINEQLGPALIGMDPADQAAIDDKLKSTDGSSNKSAMGANSLLAISLAVARAGAAESRVPLYRHLANLGSYEDVILPVPAFCLFEGGDMAPSTRLPFKEFCLMPTNCASYSEAIRVGVEVFAALEKVLKEKKGDASAGSDSAFVPDFEEIEDALAAIVEAIDKAGYTDQAKLSINLDGNRLLIPKMGEEKDGEGEEKMVELPFDEDDELRYNLAYKVPGAEDSKAVTNEEFATMLGELIEKYPIVSMEDPFSKHDMTTLTEFNTNLGDDVQVVADVLAESSSQRIKELEAQNAVNAVLLRPVEIGTVTEIMAAIKQAQKLNWGIVLAHQPGHETHDDWLADLVVGTRCGQLKAGAPTGCARIAKYNRLLCIEDELGASAQYVGNQFRRPPA